MKQPARVRWGVLSTASIATAKVIPALRRCRNAELAAIASRDIHRANAIAARFEIPEAHGTYDALLRNPNVDAVYIALPNSMHCEWTERAARSGKHVLCEKPAALSASAAEDMLAVCRNNNLLFAEGFMYRFHPQFEYVRRWLAEQRIGPLRLIRISFSFALESRHSRIRLQSALGGGALADVGSYGIDLSRWLAGADPVRVFALGGGSFGASPSIAADVETSYSALLQYPAGVHALLDGGFDRPRDNRCEIAGQSGTIVVSSPFIPVEDAFICLRTETGEERLSFPAPDLFRSQFEYFSARVLSGEFSAESGVDAVGNARVLEALRTSLDSGNPIELLQD